MEKERTYSELCRLIRGTFGTQKAFAAALNMHPTALSARLSGKTQWKHDEVVRACQALKVTLADASEYFF